MNLEPQGQVAIISTVCTAVIRKYKELSPSSVDA